MTKVTPQGISWLKLPFVGSPVFLMSSFFLFAACSDASMKFPVTEVKQGSLKNIEVVKLDAENISLFGPQMQSSPPTTLPQRTAAEYRIGTGDLISIFVFDHPELAIPVATGETSTGFLVQADGTLTYPFVGAIAAKNKTVEELRAELAKRLVEYFPDPQVDVRVVGFNSQRVVVGGQVLAPNVQFIRNSPLTLLEAVNSAGGLAEKADASSVIVRRGGVSHRVDLEEFYTSGLDSNNPVLVGGDVVSVPEKSAREAYLLGEVQKPATIDLSDETVTLTQAITRQGGLNEVRADARGVFVFRNVLGQMTVFQLDTSVPTAFLLGARFALHQDDVVYITKSPLQRWNDTMSRLLPSVSAIKEAQSL